MCLHIKQQKHVLLTLLFSEVAKADLKIAKDEFAKTEPAKEEAVGVHEKN